MEKIIFYSDNCTYSKKMLEYLDKHKIKNMFKMINIDSNEIPKNITIVPTIIDVNLNQILEVKKAFDYLLNMKYFNNPTNNIELVKELPLNPEIDIDEKAININTGMEIPKDLIVENVTPPTVNKSKFFHLLRGRR